MNPPVTAWPSPCAVAVGLLVCAAVFGCGPSTSAADEAPPVVEHGGGRVVDVDERSDAIASRRPLADVLEEAATFGDRLLEVVNAGRRAQGSRPLQASEPLSSVADRALAGAGGDPSRVRDAVELGPIREALATRGYQARTISLGFVQANGSADAVLRAWLAQSPHALDDFSDPALHDLGVGAAAFGGDIGYLVLAAVSARGQGAAETRALQDVAGVRDRVLQLVDGERRRHGLGPLGRDVDLETAAQRHADDMLARGFFDHVDPQGATVLDRARAAGYRPRLVAENLASGHPTPEEAVEGWMASPDHRANILRPDVRDTGVGLAYGPVAGGEFDILWVQVFGAER
ncbi:MAG: CAP domain-containing protein [Acidobacteriota bacterium]